MALSAQSREEASQAVMILWNPFWTENEDLSWSVFIGPYDTSTLDGQAIDLTCGRHVTHSVLMCSWSVIVRKQNQRVNHTDLERESKWKEISCFIFHMPFFSLLVSDHGLL